MKDLIVKMLSFLKIDVENYIEVPADEKLGDYALPCFALAKEMRKNPAEIAKEIALKVNGERNKDFEKVEAVGPYVNFFINRKAIVESALKEILKEKGKYGQKKNGKKIMIEFSQPNTHKAFHVGHIRGTSLGESLARIKEWCGYKVIRANYSGDTGMHIAKWLWCYKKFHKNEKIRNEEEWFAKIYVEAVQKLEGNEDAEKEVEEINRKIEDRSDKNLIKLWKDTRKKSIAAWKPIYKDLNVRFNVNYFESEIEKDGKEISLELLKEGIAEKSEGATIMNFKDIGLGVWVLLRKDDTVLYSAKDLALARKKLEKYKIDDSLVITSVEQNLHFQQLIKTLEIMKFPNWKNYGHMGYESVRLPEGKMSSRTGSNILYKEFRDEIVGEAKKEIFARTKLKEKELNNRALKIAIAAMKYSMLKQDANKVIIFDKNEALRFEGETGPYLLYSYARARSILRKAKYKQGKFSLSEVSDSEKLMVKQLSEFPAIVEQANKALDSSAVAHYAYSLCQRFNEFYHSEKVIGSEKEKFRLAIVDAFSIVLKNALYLLGIETLEEM